MKKDIHPEVNPVVFVDSTSGAKFVSTSTAKSEKKVKIDGIDHYVITVEVSSASHPFFTGKKILLDNAGRVEKFEARRKAAQLHKQAEGEQDMAKKAKKAA
jgi:large subunit ribosomal protein L31